MEIDSDGYGKGGTGMNPQMVLLRLLVFPGMLYAISMAWFVLWLERKVTARLQRRVGPPFYQPFFDFIKLLAKQRRDFPDLGGRLVGFLPFLSLAAMLGSAALIPVVPFLEGFTGDIVLLVMLLEVPALCLVLTGFASRSIFGEVGAVREAVLTLSYNIPFLLGIVALSAAAKSLSLPQIVQTPWGVVRILAVTAIALCLPAKLRINPFSISNAEQEIYAGPLTEIGGGTLAIWELVHGMEWVILCGLVAVFILPPLLHPGIQTVLFILVSVIIALILTGIATATARLKVNQASRFYWLWGLVFAFLAILITSLVNLPG
jgi:formate hydrogenlyase subunit 4